jgi:acylphosphatase
MVEQRIRRRVVVSGRVQGVAFRAGTRAEARRLGVDGWVRNRADGRVEAVFEGDARAVAVLVAWCSQGPRFARVAEVEVSDEAPEGLAGFEVR